MSSKPAKLIELIRAKEPEAPLRRHTSQSKRRRTLAHTVNINLSIDDATGQLLTRLAEERGETRTALVRRAVVEWLERHQETPRWPEAIMEFKGTADMPLFEASRDKLIHPAADPLS